jgi:hypothetical protein
MTIPPDDELPADLADRTDRAVEAFWHGDTTELERLLQDEVAAGPPIGGVLGSLLQEQAAPVTSSFARSAGAEWASSMRPSSKIPLAEWP